MSIATNDTHPFSTPGACEGEWLQRLRITSQHPAFRFVASERLISALDMTQEIADVAVPTAHGDARVIVINEISPSGPRSFRTVKLTAEVIDNPWHGARFGTKIIMVVTQLQPGSDQYIVYGRITGDGDNIAIHDVDVADMGYPRTALAAA